MPVTDADAGVSYLLDDIAQASVSAAAQRHKAIGHLYIETCKDMSRQPDGTYDETALKGYILAAVNLLQTYHDAI